MMLSMKMFSFCGYGWLVDEAMVIRCLGAFLGIEASVSFLHCQWWQEQFHSHDL